MAWKKTDKKSQGPREDEMGDVLERYLSWRDMWKIEIERLVLFMISCQQLLAYDTGVRSKMMGVPDDDWKAVFYSMFCCPRSLVW